MLAAVPDLEAELGRLFGEPLERFTGERNALVKRLRAAGQTEAAERVQALRKPSVPAWTINQLARRHEADVRRLADAGEQLARQQEAVLAGKPREGFEQATTEHRRAVEALTALARDVLGAAGRSPYAGVERVSSSLHAASLDPDARAVLLEGRLEEEVAPGGFDGLAGFALSGRRADGGRGRGGGSGRSAERAEARRALAEARRELTEAKAAERERASTAREAERAAAELRRALAEAEREAEAARERVDEAAAAVADAARRVEELKGAKA